ncbi:endonuclease VII domain-containing protein [Nonomuraea sp. NPDC004580]|uniref:endonuclease VII domain-containing protein n=1 Tax=Nonomuraea sp. NPDC004580 TaxID=3154552 RepID=UPI0033B925E8
MEWRDNNREKVLDTYLRRAFGVTLDHYRDLLAKQDGGCAICGWSPDVPLESQQGQGRHARLVVDHCHATGKVRGLLCGMCNKAIGHLREDPAIVQLAAEYLEARA